MSSIECSSNQENKTNRTFLTNSNDFFKQNYINASQQNRNF